MKRIQWNSQLSVGVEQIDSQHKELIRIANTLLEVIEQKSSRDVVSKVIGKLREYTVYHFNSEEQLMEDVQYPKRTDHYAEHKILKRDVLQYQRTLYEKKSVTVDEVLKFITDWLLTHILNFDRELAAHIRENSNKTRSEESAIVGKNNSE